MQRGQVVVGSEHVVVDDHVGQKVVTCIGEPRGSTAVGHVVPPTIIDRTLEGVMTASRGAIFAVFWPFHAQLLFFFDK